ncbi:DEAD/DEAH box helicase [Actinomyces naeslundii]|uniref:DEAD/DEAH box helicase n=1 Tax=Actinomyces naeslundii TaxID=1655 RepID=A0AA47FGM7_ACTNA|nr:DEAD/DEAH box helicase [Actinomyces naeslundii]OMG17346.1 DEAD/DEAH box helicase [Actinomyces naeslundii]PKY95776.1 DEAD/DEAH box helicase [Actinomyces naeslundii]WAL41986.1 DEAD/DEAH box helicase [Actinomyces naeslundii]
MAVGTTTSSDGTATASAYRPGWENFSQATRTWFSDAFPTGPTAVQERAWAAIGQGENALVIAPTGSGKTLAAFLSAIDRLGRLDTGEAEARERPEPAGGVRVVYISPLKALGADVERNLRRPLAGIAAVGPTLPISVGVRSGDTPARERRRLREHPPEILITTPESLYLILTSAARETLRTVETVIVDEIHSFAGSKRGTHLALSLERLDDLLERPAQRVGLSATVSPHEEVARFLGGPHPVTVIADDGRATPEVTVAVPVENMVRIPAISDRRTRMEQAVGSPSIGAAGRSSGLARAGTGDAWRSDRALRRAMAAGQVEQSGRTGLAGASRVPGSAGPARVSGSIWPHLENAILDQVLAHRTTLVFVNSRGACERLTARLNEAYAARGGSENAGEPEPRLASHAAPPSETQAPVHRESWEMGTAAHTEPMPQGAPVIARAHHGSVSKEQRLDVERRLASGELRCVVATASLELGIDIGSIDLVLQVAPPPSVAAGLQRVGRADHRVGGRPRGVIYPVERTHLVDAVVAAEGMRAGTIEHTVLVTNALDVLAQQTVAAVSAGDLTADGWFATVTRAAPYASLPRRAFESVLTLLSGGFSTADLSDFSPRIVWDRATGRLSARPNAQRLAVTSSGTIPDRGMFPVVLPEGAEEAGRRRVGELDEEMVNESSPGDIITLGTSSWRIRQITGDRVVVDPAEGRSARLPFWRGEGLGRPVATGLAKGAFLREAQAGLKQPGSTGESEAEQVLRRRLMDAGLDAHAQDNLVGLLREQCCATGVLPTDETLVLERNRDESGSWRLIIHSTLGRRVHEPWAMAIRERVQQVLGIKPQVTATDDGIVLQIPVLKGRLPGAELVVFDPLEVSALVRSRIDETALFAARFRECAARALLMPTTRPGHRTPLWLQRVKAGQLLEAARQFQDFPVSVEAARECLQEYYDLPALTGLMERLGSGRVRVVEADTTEPSPFAHPLLFGYTSTLLYQEDLPHAEHRARLLSLDPQVLDALLGDGGLAELLDDEVMAEVEAELQHLVPGRRARADAEGIADLLRELGPLTDTELVERCDDVGESGGDDVQEGSGVANGLPAAVRSAVDELADAGRALRVTIGGREHWVRIEDAGDLHLALGTAIPESVAEQAALDGVNGAAARTSAARSPLNDLVLRHARVRTLITRGQVAEAFGIGASVAEAALRELAGEGSLMSLGDAGWMESSVFTRVRNRSLARARAAVAPVAPEVLQRLVLERAGLDEVGSGVDALAEALAALEGVWLPADLWESVVLPARVADYRPAMLDELIAAGEVIWQARPGEESASGQKGSGRTGPGERGSATPARADDVVALGEIAFFPTDSALAPVVGDALAWAGPRTEQDGDLSEEGSEDERWRQVREGAATGRSFEPVRRSLEPAPKAHRAPARRVRSRRTMVAMPQTGGQTASGRLSSVLSSTSWVRISAAPASAEERAIAEVESLLDRYGVVSRDVTLAFGGAGGLVPLMPVLRRMEDTGTVLRGGFVEGLGPAQFAERETVDRLRFLGQKPAGARGSGTGIVLDLKDPACLVGRGPAWPEPALPAGIGKVGIEGEEAGGAPQRRRGASVVLIEGAPVLYASDSLKVLISYTSEREVLTRALGALATARQGALARQGSPPGRHRTVVESLNGVSALDRAVSDLLRQAGFVSDPRGMRLAVGPYGASFSR